MRTTVNVKFKPSTNGERTGTIYYQIICNHTTRKIYTDYKITQDEWNLINRCVSVSYNSKCNTYLREIQNNIRNDFENINAIIDKIERIYPNYSADIIIKEYIDSCTRYSLFNYTRNLISMFKDYGKIRTSETYTTALNSFKHYRNNKDIAFHNISVEIIEGYSAYLYKKGLIPNSISFYMRILRAVYNRAVCEGLTNDKNPFRKVYTGVDKTIKRAVNIDIIRKIKNIDLSSHLNLDFSRDMFLFSFYTRGMAFVDMAFLKKENLQNGVLSYRRRKTGQLLTMKWTSEMQEIIKKYPENSSDYLLPIIIDENKSERNQYRNKQYKVNRDLKIIGDILGLNISLTAYVARHSWASIAKAKGISISTISECLGHDREETTQIYLASLDTNEVDRANDLILNSLN